MMHIKKLHRNNKLGLIVPLIIGQTLSLCISTTSLVTTVLSKSYDMNQPTLQTVFVYLALAVVYIPVVLYKNGFKHFFHILNENRFLFLLFGLFDVEGNYFVVKGFEKTSFISAMLITSFSTPCCVLLSVFILKTKYRLLHYFAVLCTLVGLGLLMLNKYIQHKETISGTWLGDVYCLLGGFLYACSNITMEYNTRQMEFYKVLALLGLYGTAISTVQVFALEYKKLGSGLESLTSLIPGLLVSAYTAAMFVMYSLTPVLIHLTNSTFFNVSLLTSEFYNIVVNQLFIRDTYTPLYWIAFTIVVGGLGVYNIKPVITREPGTLAEPELD